jgi:hypothetical protein
MVIRGLHVQEFALSAKTRTGERHTAMPSDVALNRAKENRMSEDLKVMLIGNAMGLLAIILACVLP